MFGYSHDIHVTIASVGISCWASHYYNLQDSQIDSAFSLLVVYVAPSSTIKTSQYEWSF